MSATSDTNGPAPAPEMPGRLRRRIVLRADVQSAFGALEDDYHRMQVRLQHAGGRVTGVEAELARHPLTICPEARQPLQAFVGIRLGPRPDAETEAIDPRWQCTHLYDLAMLLLAQACRGGERRYDLDVLDPVDGDVDATLHRDGSVVLAWNVRGTVITGPSPHAGQDLRQLASWPLEGASDDEREAIRILRRGMLVARGRRNPMPTQPHHGVPRTAKALAGACHSFQPIHVVRAREVFGNRQDFTQRPDDLLRDLQPTP